MALFNYSNFIIIYTCHGIGILSYSVTADYWNIVARHPFFMVNIRVEKTFCVLNKRKLNHLL